MQEEITREITREKLESIMEKIAALKKFNVDNATEGEVANATAKIEELLMKYNLELSDIIDEEFSEGIESDLVTTGAERWKWTLMTNLAKYHLCDAVVLDRSKVVALFGLKHNREIVTHLFFAVSNQLNILARIYYADYNGPASRHMWRRSFFEGALKTIKSRLEEMKQKMQSESNACTSLILVTQEALTLAMKEKYDYKSIGQRTFKPLKSAYEAGMSSGKIVNFNPAIK